MYTWAWQLFEGFNKKITFVSVFELGYIDLSYDYCASLARLCYVCWSSFTLLSAAVFYFVYLAFHHFYTPSYTGLQSGSDFEYTSDDIGRLKSQDIGEGAVKIRCTFGFV